MKDLRSTPRQGRVRAQILDSVNNDAQIMASYMSLLLGGVADCLEIASQRGNEVNRPALSVAVRPTVEAAAQVWWLLDDSVSATERARRYLIWRFSDLRQLRSTARDLKPDGGGADETEEALAEQERALLELTENAGWNASPTSVRGQKVTAAALLDEVGKRESMPRYGELVGLAINTTTVYGLLSLPVHGTRWAVLQGLQTGDPEAEGKHRMAGSGVEPNAAIATVTTATYRAGRALADWNRLDSAQLRRAAQELGQQVGLRRRGPQN